jgi:ABC-type polysaccharide/polyol phosphate export permease
MKMIDIAVKNMKLILRDKKVILMIVLIPIFYYSLMGLVFGGSGGIDISQYTVGYINADLDTDVEPINSYQSIDMIVGSIDNATKDGQQGLFKLKNMTLTNSTGHLDLQNSIEAANTGLVKEGIVTYIIFESGFQAGLNQAGMTTFGIIDNDTSTNPSFYPQLKGDFLYSLLENMNYEVKNLSLQDFDDVKQNMTKYGVDYLFVIDEGYENGLINGNPNLSLYYPDYLKTLKADIMFSTLNATINQVIEGAGGQQVRIARASILQVSSPFLPAYTMYFLSSTNPTTIMIINSTFQSIVEAIINYNPNAIEFAIKSAQTEGKAINNLTYNSPGYLLYGVLNIMSFAMILITTEIKDGQFKRLLSSRMKISDLLWGNILCNTTLTFLQIALGLGVLSLWGMTPYYVNLGTFIGGTILTTLAISIFVNALALVLVPVFKTPDAAAGGVWLFLIPLMTFSGAFFPVEFLSESIANFARWIPTRMAVLAFQAIMVNGLPLTDIKFWGNTLGCLGMGLALYFMGLFTFYRFTHKVERQNIKNGKPNSNKAKINNY